VRHGQSGQRKLELQELCRSCCGTLRSGTNICRSWLCPLAASPDISPWERSMRENEILGRAARHFTENAERTAQEVTSHRTFKARET
jgi:hypothetical protein